MRQEQQNTAGFESGSTVNSAFHNNFNKGGDRWRSRGRGLGKRSFNPGRQGANGGNQGAPVLPSLWQARTYGDQMLPQIWSHISWRTSNYNGNNTNIQHRHQLVCRYWCNQSPHEWPRQAHCQRKTSWQGSCSGSKWNMYEYLSYCSFFYLQPDSILTSKEHPSCPTSK